MAQVYDIRTINSVAPPLPMQFKREFYDLDKDSYTTASGLLIRNKIAVKNKFFVTLPPMNKTEMQTFLSLINDETLTIQYENIFDGTLVTGTFYHGDISQTVRQIYSEDNSDVLYDEFTINFIEY